MIPSTDRDEHGFRDVWGSSLSWFRKPPASAEKRARQAELIEAIKAELADVESAVGLHARCAGDSRWILTLARREFPRDWPALGVHACTSSAYALRFIELQTGHRLDAKHLPTWIGEWAVW